MSTNYTENYSLCQWEPGDNVLRADFNEDNAKIDAALGTISGKVSSLESASYTNSRPQVAAGAFEGDGNESQRINIGFRPKVVMVLSQNFQAIYNLSGIQHTYSGYAVEGVQMSTYTPAVTITASGFYVYYKTSGTVLLETNLKGFKYLYLAIR